MTDSNDDKGGFLSRWSQRKVQGKQGERAVVPALPSTGSGRSDEKAQGERDAAVRAEPASDRHEPVLRHAQDDRVVSAIVPAPVRAEPVSPTVLSLPKEAPPLPSLEDVAQLTRESDFSRFVAPGVDVGVKNAAMKKLFTDPHFNVMDGLDIYIDDYNKFEPIPKSMLRQMVQARALGLLDDELEEQDKPAPDNPPIHEDTDLQLQPDDAAGQPGADEGLAGSDAVDHAGEPAVGDTIEPDELSHHPEPPRSA